MAINAASVLVALLALVVSIFAYKAERLAAQRAAALEKATHETELRGRRSEAITLSTIIQGRAGALAYKYLKLRDRLQSIPDSGSPDEQDLRSRIDRRAIDHQAHYDGATNVLAELFDDSKMAGKDLAYFDKLIAKNRGASASLDNPVYDEMVVDSEKEIVALEASNP